MLAAPLTAEDLTIDQLAATACTTTRSIRSFQTLGLMPHPDLHGRTGMYGPAHQQRLLSILRLQSRGFSLQSLALLFAAHERGDTLGDVLDLADDGMARANVTRAMKPETDSCADADEAELYGFAQLQGRPARWRGHGRVRPVLSIVPTTVWDETEAS